MTGEELHEAMLQGCIKNCEKCKLYLKENKHHCLIKCKKAWEQWTKEESNKLEEKLRNEETV